MRNELSQRVYPVVRYAIALRERLGRGESPALAVEQSAFIGLLGARSQDQALVDYDGDSVVPLTANSSSADPAGTTFLGARYVLVCWLDELFLLEAPWSEQWNEHKLEAALYAGNDRAWRFWSQAQLAASRGLIDALEVFWLCVMLGFRGQRRDQPEKLAEWLEAVGQQIRCAQSRRWPAPADLLPLAQVQPLHGRRDLRMLLVAASLSACLLVPVITLLVLRAAS